MENFLKAGVGGGGGGGGGVWWCRIGMLEVSACATLRDIGRGKGGEITYFYFEELLVCFGELLGSFLSSNLLFYSAASQEST